MLPGRRALLEKIVEARELPEEVLDAIQLFLDGKLELNEEQYPQLVRVLMKAPDDGEGPRRIGGILFR